jgi:ADP-ribose pyrophosphatase YjhB (NUDIX family)
MDGQNAFDDSRFWVAVDTVVFTLCDRDLKTLLVRRDHAPCADCWALPGNSVQIDESRQQRTNR